MRRVILQEFVTLDGLAAGPNDSVDFVPASTQGDQSFGERQMGFMDSIDAILLVRIDDDPVTLTPGERARYSVGPKTSSITTKSSSLTSRGG